MSAKMGCTGSGNGFTVTLWDNDDCSGDPMDFDQIRDDGIAASPDEADYWNSYYEYFEYMKDGVMTIKSGCYNEEDGESQYFEAFYNYGPWCSFSDDDEDEPDTEGCSANQPASVDVTVSCATGALGKLLAATGLSVWLILLILVLVGLFITGVVFGILK